MSENTRDALAVLREVALGNANGSSLGRPTFTAPNGASVTLLSERERLSFIAGGLAAVIAEFDAVPSTRSETGGQQR
jgi:hypothetical protein